MRDKIMRNICIICEGQTEVNFVQECLVPHLLKNNVYLHARILQAQSGRHRGGRVTVERLATHISHEYRSYDAVTTFVDFYGFQDRDGRSKEAVETAILQAVQKRVPNLDERFVLPYVQLHEFEGLLFSDTDKFDWVIDGWSDAVADKLHKVAAQFDSPEDINDSPQTAPSKRIEAIFPPGSYTKTEHGPLIAESIGMEVIREKCPEFNKWLLWLEGTL